MRKILFLLMTIISCGISNVMAQELQPMSIYDSGMMNTYLNAVREMAMRISQIRQTVQPYREQQLRYYQEGKYHDAIELCNRVYKQYVYYVKDNRAIYDMEVLAGDCALEIGEYESAIGWYRIVQNAEVEGIGSRLSQVFDAVMDEARDAYRNRYYSSLWNYLTIAQKTGWESGELYFYYGVCYENSNDFVSAKKMYKLAKKKNYLPAITALQELKNRR